jgi:hypothetical protein
MQVVKSPSPVHKAKIRERGVRVSGTCTLGIAHVQCQDRHRSLSGYDATSVTKNPELNI